jgi:hypothetical protein
VARTRSGSRPIAAVATIVGAIAAAALGGLGLFVVLGPWPGFELGRTDRRHLDEIPIDPAAACGKVETIHDALDSLNGAYTAAIFGLDAQQWEAFLDAGTSASGATAPRTNAPWSSVKAGLDASALRLDLVLADGIPHFPPRVQRELTAVRRTIAEGRAVLPKVENAGALNLVRTAFERGQLHAGYAGDLVGDQCAVPLGA